MPYFATEIELLKVDFYLLGAQILMPGTPAEVLVNSGSGAMPACLTSSINQTFPHSFIED